MRIQIQTDMNKQYFSVNKAQTVASATHLLLPIQTKTMKRKKKASFSFITIKSARNKKKRNQIKHRTKTRSEELNRDGNKQTNHLQTPELTTALACSSPRLLLVPETNRGLWTPFHEQIKRAREAAPAPPWHQEVVANETRSGTAA